MTKTCPACAKATAKKYGPPKQMPSGFVDQVIYCPKCDWCGVVSVIVDVKEPVQLQLL